MSGSVAVGTQFQNAVTATGLQLDNNFGNLVSYANDPTNRNNYVADSGTTNTVLLTFSPAVAGGYTAGLELTWKWAQTNSGSVVINANGLGNASLVHADGTNLAAGEGMIGSIAKAVSDGTRFIFITPTGTAASAAQVSAAATLVPYVTPGTMKNHPGVAKAWAVWNGTSTGTITAAAGYNVTSIARLGAGTYSVVFTTAFASTDYAAIVTAQSSGFRVAGVRSKTTTGCAVITEIASTDNPSDADFVSFSAFGNQ